MDKNKLNEQSQHWDGVFSNRKEMFGTSPSIAAIKTVEVFKKEGVKNILEIGGGQGRDTLFFAKNNFNVKVIDYSKIGVENIIKNASILDLERSITTKCHDARKPLPFENEIFDGCFSHMLYCMAFTTLELEFLSKEICRVLKSKGINIYTVRNTKDADFRTGIHRGEDLYESEGFIVHFFSEEKIKQLSSGFEILNIENFEEGKLPRKLFRITLRKK